MSRTFRVAGNYIVARACTLRSGQLRYESTDASPGIISRNFEACLEKILRIQHNHATLPLEGFLLILELV